MNELALFAGAGGGILAGKELGWRTVCAVEWEPYPASVLMQRQNDGLLPAFPIWDDVQTFDGNPWRGVVDVVSGGFPCQDISAAGRGAGISGERSGMWAHMARIIGEVRPRYAFIENSPMLTVRGLDRVLCDLAAMGYDARWGVLGASDVGAPHQRDRIWIVGNSNSKRELQSEGVDENKRGRAGNSSEEVADTDGPQCKRDSRAKRSKAKYANASKPAGWEIEPDVGRVANGVAFRMDRLKAIGNGQVPQCAAEAWRRLTGVV